MGQARGHVGTLDVDVTWTRGGHVLAAAFGQLLLVEVGGARGVLGLDVGHRGRVGARVLDQKVGEGLIPAHLHDPELGPRPGVQLSRPAKRDVHADVSMNARAFRLSFRLFVSLVPVSEKEALGHSRQM